MNSFYIEGRGETGAVCPLKAEEARHALQVLRLKTGEEVYVVDEVGSRFAAEIASAGKEECTVLLREVLSDNESPLRFTLYQGLPKADKLEWIVQKLTELGAARIVPVKMERCVVKTDAKDAEKKRDRLDKIAREASKQCKRALSPQIETAQTFRQIEAALRTHELVLVAWEDAEDYGLRAAREAFPNAKDIALVIGPEGGMSAQEVAYLETLGAKRITLGPRILRTETAAMAGCAAVMALWGDLA